MLIIAGVSVVVTTALEIVLLVLLPQGLWERTIVLASGNLLLAFLVGYLVFNLGSPRAAGRRRERNPVMNVVHDTLPYLRQGFNRETATKTAHILMQSEHVLGVMITNAEHVLASAGPDFADTMFLQTTARLATQSSRSGKPSKTELSRAGSQEPSTMLVTPIKTQSDQILGAVAVLTASGDHVLPDLEQSTGLFAQLIAMQVELGQKDRQAQLVAEAELNALRAQINPHFLFNALNTIVSYSREDPDTTRRLLVRLADLFRSSIYCSGQMVSFQEEYHNLKNYLFIEQARFQGKLQVIYDIDPPVLKVNIPALSVQPLVENAVRHGIQKKAGPGTLTLQARLDFLALRIVIQVKDDGVGMSQAELAAALRPRPANSARGVGISNINERLKRLYGETYRLQLESTPGKGTIATLRIPMR